MSEYITLMNEAPELAAGQSKMRPQWVRDLPEWRRDFLDRLAGKALADPTLAGLRMYVDYTRHLRGSADP